MPRQKWRGISIFGMTNPFEPPKRLALGDAELAEALAEAQGQEGALGAMELLERQSQLRAADYEAYVRWVREMEALATPEAKQALSAARRNAAGLSPETELESGEAPEVTEDSWKSLVPDWDARQEAIEIAKENAVAEALQLAREREASEIESAVAEALAEAEREAEAKRAEAVARIREEAEALAAEKLAEEIRSAQEEAEALAQQKLAEEIAIAKERAEALAAENLAKQLRLEQELAEAEAERQRLEIERLESERLEAERKAAEAQALRAEELMREEIERAELAALQAQIEAEDAARESNESEIDGGIVVELIEDPEPVRAADFATGSFDIVEAPDQNESEESAEFDLLLSDGELGFAKETSSLDSGASISTIDRRSKPYSQLFVWSSLSAGVLPLLFGFFTSSLELTFVDKLVSLILGLSISALVIAVAAVGGKRSGLPTLYLSRAAFGVRANYVPAMTLILVKIIFGTALLIAGLSLFDQNIIGAPSFAEPAIAGLSVSWLVVAAAILLVVSATLAFFGGKVLYITQLAIASISVISSLLFMGVTAGQVSLASSDLVFSSNWVGITGLAVLVAFFFGGFWISSVAEFTRKVSMAQSGKKLGLFIAVSAGLIPLLIAGYSLMLSTGLSLQVSAISIENPLGALLMLVPTWLSSVLLISAVLSLTIWVASWLYSTSASLSAVSIRLRPAVSQPILLLLALSLVFLVTFLSALSFEELVDAIVAVSGVLVFAWAGIFVADITLRRIAYHELSLTREYGFYKAANFSNLVGFVLSVAVGFGFVSSNVAGLDWLGYFARLTGSQVWADANVGIAIALGLSVLFPILFGRKRIRSQELEVLAIEARRNELDNVELDEA